MSHVVTRPQRAPERDQNAVSPPDLVWYAVPVVVGCLLLTWMTAFQPYHNNELVQLASYYAPTYAEFLKTPGTTPPPEIGQVAGYVLQHVVGVGQFTQRLLELASGMGTLVLFAALLWRRRLGRAGAAGVWFLALSPLMLRFTPYARPYSIPLFLMVAFVFAVEGWRSDRRRLWLVLAALAAIALPFSRAVEPPIFLGIATVMLAFHLWRGHLKRAEGVMPTLIAGAALLFVAYPVYRVTSSSFGGLAETNPAAALFNVGPQFSAIFTIVPRVLAAVLPWWPVTLALVIVAFALPASRRWLLGWWAFPALAAPPLLFVLLFHLTLNRDPITGFFYQPRFAYFFVLPVALMVTAVAVAVIPPTGLPVGRARWAAGLVVLVLVAQLPMTVTMLTVKQEPDWEVAADTVRELPDDTLVLYDHPQPAGWWRQVFGSHAVPRYYQERNAKNVLPPAKIARQPGKVRDLPIRVMLLDRPGNAIRFGRDPAVKTYDVPGWSHEVRDRFLIYEPDTELRGKDGLLVATKQFGEALGPRYGYMMWVAHASLLARDGRDDEARDVLRQLYAAADNDREAMVLRRQARGIRPLAKVAQSLES